MPVIAIGLFLLVLLLNHASDFQTDVGIASDADQSRIVAEQMIIVRNSASLYAEKHNSTTAGVSRGELNIDSSLVLDPCIKAFIDAGKAYAYCNGGPNGLHGELFEQSDRSFFVGVNSKGVLRNAATGTDRMTIPKTVPDGAVVYAQ